MASYHSSLLSRPAEPKWPPVRDVMISRAPRKPTLPLLPTVEHYGLPRGPDSTSTNDLDEPPLGPTSTPFGLCPFTSPMSKGQNLRDDS
uniref:Uncharacterized protein n=1 Tax=Vespula pensylvanica TaxID=30213 RepID=A0A834K7V4_VESPE|nr:hypothetical protein H0235_015711 [Vespula pensylvanica]